jgi:hypothetical protein
MTAEDHVAACDGRIVHLDGKDVRTYRQRWIINRENVVTIGSHHVTLPICKGPVVDRAQGHASD